MLDEYRMMFDELSKLRSNENQIVGNDVLRVLKKYSSTVSVFDMMQFSSKVIEENKYVQETYREDSQKSYIESFLLRIKDIVNDDNDYPDIVDDESFDEAIRILKTQCEDGDSESRVVLIFEISSLYATFVLEEPIHPVGTPFPGSLKVEFENGAFLCPVKDANRDTPNAVCRLCLAEQLEF